MIGPDNHEPYVILCFLEEILTEENWNDEQLNATTTLQNLPIFPPRHSCNTVKPCLFFRPITAATS